LTSTPVGQTRLWFAVKRGATSLTEAWDPGAIIPDHFMLGQIQEWFYHDLAGIQNAPDSPGFKKIIIIRSLSGT